MTSHFIHLKNVSLELPASQIESERSLRQAMKRSLFERKNTKAAKKPITLLEDITLDLKNGDRLGLVGSNGAGKTSLLKLLAGIYPPSKGNYDVAGNIRCMINVNVGLELEATGYENILLFCAIENYPHSIIKKVTQYVEEFSGLGDYLNAPIRTYSSGMATRLTFSMITAFETEILLIDEFFSTGDAAFIKKSSDRLKNIISSASIFVFASHDLKLLQELCPKSVLLQKGKIINYGDSKTICQQYREIATFSV